MVRDLEAEKGVDGVEGFRVGGGDLDFSPGGGVKVSVADFAAQPGHDRSAGRDGVMDEHRDIEIACCEALDDVGEVHADQVARRGVLGIVGGDVDEAAGFEEVEMMSGGFVGKAHGVVAAGGHCVVVGRGLLHQGGGSNHNRGQQEGDLEGSHGEESKSPIWVGHGRLDEEESEAYAEGSFKDRWNPARKRELAAAPQSESSPKR